MQTDLPFLSVRLRELREAAKLSYKDLERLSGITDQTFINIERGGGTSIEKALVIARVFGVRVSTLFPPDPVANPPKKTSRKSV